MKILNYASRLIGNTAQIFLMFILLPWSFSSCTEPRFYTPGSNPMPLFRYRGDIYANISSNAFNKYDGTLGYAFTNSFAAYASFGRSAESSDDIVFKSEVPFYSRGSYQNYGLGYFMNKGKSERVRFEAFADLCLGNYKVAKYSDALSQSSWTSSLSGKYQRVGLVFNIGSTSRNGRVQYGYSARLGNLKFYDPVIENEKYLQSELRRLNSKKDYYLLEHGFFSRYGRGPIKFQVSCMFYHGLWSQPEANAIQRLNFTYIVSFIYSPNVYGRNRASNYLQPQHPL